MPISKHKRNGVRRPRSNLKNGGHPSIKRAMAEFITNKLKSNEMVFCTQDIRAYLRNGF